jgi:hypothetical protein
MNATNSEIPGVPDPTPAPTGSDNSFSRIFGVIFSPQATFASIVRRPTWVVPLLLVVVVSLAIVALFSQRVGWRAYMLRQDQQNSSVQKKMEQMTPEERDRMVDQQTKFAGPFAYIAVGVITPIAALIVAGVFLLVFKLSSSSNVPFVTSLGIVTYSWVPGLIGGLLGILILFIKDPSTVDLDHLVAANAGALASDDAAGWLVTLLTSFDIFVFWTMILMAFGYSATNPKKLSFGKALVTIVIVWAVWTAVKVAFKAAFA